MNINGKWYSEPELAAYIKELENRLHDRDLEADNGARQIAHYEDELRQAKELLREARVLIKHSLFVYCKDTAAARDWCDKLRKLIGEDINVPASATDNNVGSKGGADNG